MKEIRSIILVDLGKMLDETFSESIKFCISCDIDSKRDKTCYFLYVLFSKIIKTYSCSSSRLIVFHVDEEKIRFMEKTSSTCEFFYKKIVKIIKNLKCCKVITNIPFSAFCESLKNNSPIYDELLANWFSKEEIFKDLLKIAKRLKFQTIEDKYLGKNFLDFFGKCDNFS